MPTYRHRHPRTPPAIALAGLVLALALAFGAGRPAAAQQQPQAQMLDGVAAVVNDRVITYSAVEDRMRLALLASGLPTTDESVQRLRPQVLDSLVDEQLQLQAGEDAGIQVSDDDIAEAMGVIASNNNMSTETFEALLRQHDVPLSTLHDQIRATLTWRGFVQRRVVPQVDVTEEAARDVLSRIEQVEGFLSDHYDPTHKVLRLSPDNYHGQSVAAAGIAAHEVGHAIQHAKHYAPLVIRNAAVPLAGIGSRFVD